MLKIIEIVVREAGDIILKYYDKIGIEINILKLCSLAEGLIDVYARFNGTKEWDTAAAHIICMESGCKIVDIKTKEELVYNKKSIKNNYFIASRNNLSFL